MIENINNSDILSYNPNLDINTRPDIETYPESHYEEGKLKSNRSTVLDQFEIHSPSTKVQRLNNVISEIDTYKNNLINILSGNTLANRYFNTDNLEEKEEILKENYEDVSNGSTLLEVYKMYENIKDEIEEVRNNYIVSIYGKDIDEDKMSEIDNTYIEKIDSYEFNNKHEYINYFNLYYDTQISFLIGEYADRIKENIDNLNLIHDDIFTTQADSSSEKIIKTSFDKNNDLLSHDLYKNEINKNELYKAINNIFITKQNLNLYLDSFSDYCSLGDEYDIVHDIKEENIENLNEKLDILVQTVMMSSLAKDDIYKTLSKKSKIRGFFNV